MPTPKTEPEFDRFARNYDQLLADSLAGTGQENERFAEYKIVEMSIQLSRAAPRKILDFGCGVGRSLGLLARYFPDAAICGYDPSPDSLDEASRRVPAATLYGASAVLPEAGFDAVLAANVFHHIAQEQRPAAIRSCGHALAPGGSLFVFEHNPYNPLTRRVFERCPFDEGASMLRRRAMIALGRDAGLKVKRAAYTLFLPSANHRWLRTQRLLSWFPLGAQYYVQFQK